MRVQEKIADVIHCEMEKCGCGVCMSKAAKIINLVLSELPNKRVSDDYHSYDEIKAWNEYDAEMRRRLNEQ